MLVPLPMYAGTNRLPVASPALLAAAHCSQAGSAQTRHPFSQQQRNGHATPLAARRLKRPPARYRYPRAAKGAPAGPGTRTWPVPVGSQNGATHLPPTLMRYKSPSPAPATVERAGLERHCKRLGCHHSDCDHTAGALFSLAAKAWRLHHLCHSVAAFLFFNFFAPAHLD